MEYTPLQPGQAPTFGTQGIAVTEYQKQLNQQNAGKPGWTPLVVDGMYGPKTQSASTWKPTNQIIVTGSKPATQFAKNSQAVNQMIAVKGNQPLKPVTTDTTTDIDVATYSDPYTQMLDKISATSDKATQNLIATIKATKANRMATINDETDRLKQGLMSLGLSTGNINFTPDLVYGQIAQAENARMGKLMELDRDEATALLEAQQAVEEKDFKLLKEKMDYIKSVKKSRLDLLKENYETMSYETKIAENQAELIYDELQTMSESEKLSFLQEIATRFDIPLKALVSQVSVIAQEKKKKSASGTKSSSGGYTSQELRKLRQAGIDPTNIKEADDFLYGKDSTDSTDPFSKIKPTYKGEKLKKITKPRERKLNDLGVTSEDITEIQGLLAQGYSLQQIAQNTGMPSSVFELFTKYLD